MAPSSPSEATQNRVLIYLVRRDLRIEDNPVLHHIVASASEGDFPFTHLLPVYVFPAQQIEISGFEENAHQESKTTSFYPKAMSASGNFWRCGPLRATFIAESVWNMKTKLESIGSGLTIRVGRIADAIESLIDGFEGSVGAVWMTAEEGMEEQQDELAVANICGIKGTALKILPNEKHLIDFRDMSPQKKPFYFDTAGSSVIRKIRPVLPAPALNELPPLPPKETIPKQAAPFIVPDNYELLKHRLLSPISDMLNWGPLYGKQNVLRGGEDAAWKYLKKCLMENSPSMISVGKANGDSAYFSTLSTHIGAYLSQGCITARQVHHCLAEYECRAAEGTGMSSDDILDVRLQLLRRDYASVCANTMEEKIFLCNGRTEEERKKSRGYAATRGYHALIGMVPFLKRKIDIKTALHRFMCGHTRQPIVDTSTDDLLRTGLASARGQHHTAQYLFRDAGIDWRLGAEWFEMWLIDYDVSTHWVNWKHFATSPSNRSFDVDFDGQFLREWLSKDKCAQAFAALKIIQAAAAELHVAVSSGHDEECDPVIEEGNVNYYEVDLNTFDDAMRPRQSVEIRHNSADECAASVRCKTHFNSVVNRVELNDPVERRQRMQHIHSQVPVLLPAHNTNHTIADNNLVITEKAPTMAARLKAQVNNIEAILKCLPSHNIPRVYSIAHCDSRVVGRSTDTIMREVGRTLLCRNDRSPA